VTSSPPPTDLPPDPSVDIASAARVARVDRGAVDLLTAHGRVRAHLAPQLRAAAAQDPQRQLCVGDYVRVTQTPDGQHVVDDLLPRRTEITRAMPAQGSSYRQVLATNVDVVAVAEPFDAAPNLMRVERLLALAWDSGATPVVVATKADRAGDFAAAWLRDLVGAAPGVSVVSTCALEGDVAELAAMIGAGITLAIIGPSGVGKSTLVNALAGAELMATRELRTDGKGRHTTVHRELHVLPNGATIIDTPGLRTLGLTDTESLAQVFSDLEALATACRFNDCVHQTEPGCAVLSAVDAGVLDERRLSSWRKLQREAAYQARRTDARLRAQEAAKWRAISKSHRGRGRH
jgi:ribosome biogenesis GTPase / thiamine phosphate phosphatase